MQSRSSTLNLSTGLGPCSPALTKFAHATRVRALSSLRLRFVRSPASLPGVPLLPLPSLCCQPPRHPLPSRVAKWTVLDLADLAGEFHPAYAVNRSHRPSVDARGSGAPREPLVMQSKKSSNLHPETPRSRCHGLPSLRHHAVPLAAARPLTPDAHPRPPQSSTTPVTPPECESPSSRLRCPETLAVSHLLLAGRSVCRKLASQGPHHSQTKLPFVRPLGQARGTSHPYRCTHTP